MSTRVLIPSGVLGLGFSDLALANGVAAKPDVIAIDGGSTDSGPWYLGSGQSKYSAVVSKAEWRKLMAARAALNVPLIISSCGTCGVDAMVDWMADLTREIARESGQSVKIARIYASQSIEFVKQRLSEGKCRALQPIVSLQLDDISLAAHIVALAGVEPIQQALQSGADIVLAGRATDTACIAALPIMNGEHVGAAWHGAKVTECGALCATHPTSGVVLLEVDDSGFSVTPMDTNACCTPHTVSAHMLYENTDPFLLREPGGTLDVADACYEAINAKTVRVTGSRWIADSPYTVKLEAARSTGFQTTVLTLLRDQRYVKNVAQWVARLDKFLHGLIAERLALAAQSYHLDFRMIGVDATLGRLENQPSSHCVEVGVLLIVTAKTGELSMELARLCNPHMLHFPLTDEEELPTFAFPYSPAETARGEVYEFFINHVIELDNPMQAFRLEMEDFNATG